jgi:glucokinase
LQVTAAHFILGLDIGGTSLKLGAWRIDSARLGERAAWSDGITLPATADQTYAAEAIAAEVQRFDDSVAGSAVALGIGSAGLVSDGVILQSPNTPWDHLPLAAPLSDKLGYPVTIINDADAFLLGELARSGELPHGALGITLGTGVGTAVWLHGRLLAGGSGISPEGGHITLDMFGEEANTGIPGTWESLAAKGALLRYCAERGGPLLSEAIEVAQLAETEEGDGPAKSAWRRYGHCVGAGLGSLCNLFSPQVVLIGGGLAGARKWYEGALHDALKRFRLHAIDAPQIRFVDDAPDTVARGAAYHALLELARD